MKMKTMKKKPMKIKKEQRVENIILTAVSVIWSALILIVVIMESRIVYKDLLLGRSVDMYQLEEIGFWILTGISIMVLCMLSRWQKALENEREEKEGING